jgi:hypothetical protein
MAIKETNTQTGETQTLHAGRVIEVRNFKATRNHSDTLDYTDFRTADCTEALVYVGRHAKRGWETEARELSITERFRTIDCTNLFVWRGAPSRSAEVDADWDGNPEMKADWEEYQAELQHQREEHARKVAKDAARHQAAFELAEKNRPVKGKKMVVCKGRKVPQGTVGIVAYVSGSGSVLLKDEANWQDRKADGVWVNAGNLRAV